MDESTPEADAGVARQFVIFSVAGELFAVPLGQVNEIIRYPGIVRVPLGSPSLEGLGNLRGAMLPILSFRRIIGCPDVERTDATRVVVLNVDGRTVGLVVDRMANVVTVEPDRMEPVSAIRSTIKTELLTGLIKNRDDGSMVMILDPRKIFGDGNSEDEASGAAATTAVAGASDAVPEVQLVSFMVAGQEYALPIERVEEIVQIPSAVTTVPNTAGHVLGVITLRDRLLPLVSLRRMLGLRDSELTEANKIVVVALADGISAGLVMDSVREVLRVSTAVIDAIPTVVARSSRSHEIASICRLEGGARMVSVLSVDRLFDLDEMQSVGAQAAASAGHSAADAVTAAALADDEEQFVVFRVMDEEYAVPIESVQEIVRVPDELVRIPQTPAFIEGVVNLRGAVLPILDQRRRFGLPTAERNDRQRIVVFLVGGVRTGFIVDSITQVIRVPVRAIGPAPQLCAEQRRLIRRVANLVDVRRMILLLDVDQLLELGELDELAAVAA